MKGKVLGIMMAFGAMGTFGAMAQPVELPEELPGYSIRGFSPNGEWAVSDDGNHAPLIIMNLTTGEEWIYAEEFAPGNGCIMSNTGIMVGYQVEAELPGYWENDVWTLLPLPKNTLMGYSDGISPDGNMIVGAISPSEYTGDFENTMLMPCYWQRQSDGTFSMPIILPHTTRDFTGRKPQEVRALNISTDCKTISGQMLDYFSFVSQPVLYTQDSNGEWSYSLPIDELFHPAGYEFPPFPVEPTPQEYMTEDEKTAYNQAIKNWENAGADYPDAKDYMTPDEYLEYLDAMYVYSEKYQEFDEVFWEVMPLVPNFEFNNLFMTYDGRYLASTDSKVYSIGIDGGIQYQEKIPYLIDLKTNTYKKYQSDLNINLTGIMDGGALLGQTLDFSYRIFNGYILTAGASEFMPIYNFVEGVDPSMAEWMAEKMTHTFDAYNPSDNTFYQDSVLATGVPYANADGSVMGFGQYVFWDDPADAYGYLIGLPAGAKVEQLETALPKDSIIKVYNLQGVKMLETKDAGNLRTLPHGIYIINGKKTAL